MAKLDNFPIVGNTLDVSRDVLCLYLPSRERSCLSHKSIARVHDDLSFLVLEPFYPDFLRRINVQGLCASAKDLVDSTDLITLKVFFATTGLYAALYEPDSAYISEITLNH